MSWLINPSALAIFNRFGQLLRSLGLAKLTIEPQGLIESAKEASGLEDFGPPDFQEGLQIVCKSFEEEANLSFFGRLGARDILSRVLQTRLKWVELQKSQKTEQTLNRPIIIIGLPRSGTTLLHRLLAQYPDTRALQTWELADPLSTLDVQSRKTKTQRTLGLIRKLSPGIDAKHLLEFDAPEEEVSLFNPSLWSPTFWRFGSVFSYLSWYLKQDPSQGYSVYRTMLQHFQGQTPNKRLVLKLPNHTGYLSAILEAIPEATLIQTHRDPAPVMASYLSLMQSVQVIGTRQWNASAVGKASLKMWAQHIEMNLDTRKQRKIEGLMDLRFADITKDLRKTLSRIAEFTELAEPKNIEELVAKRIEEKKNKPLGHHKYQLSDYGLTEQEVAQAFETYKSQFLAS